MKHSEHIVAIRSPHIATLLEATDPCVSIERPVVAHFTISNPLGGMGRHGGIYTKRDIAGGFAWDWAEASGQTVIARRRELEHSSQFLQVLPYVLFWTTHPVTQVVYWLTYQRQSGTGESRLLGKSSVGFGGHLDLEDVAMSLRHPVVNAKPSVLSLQDVIAWGMNREINEELGLSLETASTQFTSLILDTSNDVGRVHLGLVHAFHLRSGDLGLPVGEDGLPLIQGQEKGTHLTGWKSPVALCDQLDEFENWSQLLIKARSKDGEFYY